MCEYDGLDTKDIKWFKDWWAWSKVLSLKYGWLDEIDLGDGKLKELNFSKGF